MKKRLWNQLITTTAAVTLVCGSLFVSNVQPVSAAPANVMPPIIPKPANFTGKTGSFTINSSTTIYVQGKDATETQEIADNVGGYIKNKFAVAAGFSLNVVKAAPSGTNYLYFTTTGDDYSAMKAEGYNLDVATDHITVTANKPAGLFYGMDTIRQMLPADIEKKLLVGGMTWSIPSATISDIPRFGYRSFMLDVARHFLTVDEVKRQIDNAAQYKVNTLHLHLSDDQGWRLELKNYPQLTQIGGSQVIDDLYASGDFGSLAKGSAAYYKAATGPAGSITGFYTQDQFKDIVAYAQARYMQIVPEFDVPSHTNALLSTYGFLNPNGQPKSESGSTASNLPALPYTGNGVGFNTLTSNNPATMAFLDDLFAEVTAMSPSPYFHVGADEAAVTTKADYNWFIDYLQGLGTKYNKKLISWDSNNAATDNTYHISDIMQYWHNDTTNFTATRNAFNQGKKVIVSNQNYHYISKRENGNMPIGRGTGAWPATLPTDVAYYADPRSLVGATSDDQILGLETALWAETVGTPEGIDMLLYPRLPGYAEIGWSPSGTTGSAGWNDYKGRLLANTTRMDYQGIGYYHDPVLYTVQSVTSSGTANSYYNMNESITLANGATQLEDVINGNNGSVTQISGVTNTGAIRTVPNDLSSALGNALLFDGTKGNYVNIGKPDIPKGNSWTVSAWVNLDTTSNATTTLLAGTGATIKLEQYQNTKKVGISGNDSSGMKRDFLFNYQLTAGTWTHLAFVGSSTSTKLYVNGVLTDTLTVGQPGAINPTGTATVAAFAGPRSKLGAENIGATNPYFKGKLDELRIVEKAMTDQEIAALAAIPANSELATVYEDFEAGFGKWTAVAGTPSVDTTQKTNGTNSFVVNEAKDAISQKLTQPINGVASLWFYDTGMAGLNQQALVFDSTNPTGQIGLGVRSDISNTNYSITTGTGQTTATAIARRTGWHKLMFEFTASNGADLYLDNNKIDTVPGYAKFDSIQIGDIDSSTYPGTPTGYYDDVQVNNFSASLAAATIISPDSSLSALTINGSPVEYFTLGQKNYVVKLPYGTAAVPIVAATPTVSGSNPVITQATALPGTASVQVTAQDGSVSVYTVTFKVLPQLQPATIPATYSAYTTINTPVAGKVVPIGAQPEYPAITFATLARNTASGIGRVSTPNGSALVNNDGTWVYTPKAGFVGLDSFSIDVDQGTGTAVAQTTVNVTVNPNTAPTVGDYTVDAAPGVPVTGKVVGNDANGDVLIYSLLTPPTQGTVTFQVYGSAWTYTAKSGASGVDSFVVKVDDFKGGVVNSTVSVHVTNNAVNKTALHEAITAAQALNSNSYTTASWSSMQTALTAAVTVSNDANSTQDQADTAASALQTAISALELKVVLAAGVKLSGPSSVQSGQSFSLTYSLDNVTSNVYAQDLTIIYDKSKLRFVSGESVVNGFQVLDHSETSGTVRLLAATSASTSSVTGTMDVLKLNFEVMQLNETANSEISVYRAVVADGNGTETILTSPSPYNIQLTAQVIDKTALNDAVATAQATLTSALGQISPTLWGHYPQSAVNALSAALNSASAVLGNVQSTQAQVNQAVSDLNTALTTFAGTVNTTARIGDLALIASHYLATSSVFDWSFVQMYDYNHDNKLDISDVAAMATKILGQ